MKKRGQIAVNLAFCFIVLLFLTCPAQADATEDATERINLAICTVINLIQMVTGAIAAIVIIFAGVRWMMSGDDPSARNGSKTAIIGAFVGIIIIAITIPVINLVTSGMINGVNCDIIPGADAARFANQKGTPEPAETPGQNLPNLQIVGVTSAIDAETEDRVLTIAIKNTGNADTGDFQVQFFRKRDGEFPEKLCYNIAMHSLMYDPPIKPEGETTIKCKVKKEVYNSLGEGNNELYIMVDSGTNIKESDETDNKVPVAVGEPSQPGTIRIATMEESCDGNVDKCSTDTLSCGEKNCVKGQRCKYSGFLGLPISQSCKCEDDDSCKPKSDVKIALGVMLREGDIIDPVLGIPENVFREKEIAEVWVSQAQPNPGTGVYGRITAIYTSGRDEKACESCVYKVSPANNQVIVNMNKAQPIEVAEILYIGTFTFTLECTCNEQKITAEDTITLEPKIR